jgi:hypothetical protein
LAAELQTICETLLENSRARSVALVGIGGRRLAGAGAEIKLDEESLPKLLGDRWSEVIYGLIEHSEWTAAIHRDPGEHLHFAAIPARAALLLVLFDEASSLGLVRLRVKKAIEEISRAPRGGSSGEGGAAPAAAEVGFWRYGKLQTP